MVQKCANPECSASFRSLRDGRVFVKPAGAGYPIEGRRRPRQHRYFWLCNSCCRTMTVLAENGEIKVVHRVPSPCATLAPS